MGTNSAVQAHLRLAQVLPSKQGTPAHTSFDHTCRAMPIGMLEYFAACGSGRPTAESLGFRRGAVAVGGWREDNKGENEVFSMQELAGPVI
jgi:hypothetical protein